MTLLIDRVLNYVTMYRLVFYYSATLLAAAFALGFFGLVPADPTALAFSFVIILATCWLTNNAFARLLRVPANAESIYITAFILALILPPVTADARIGVAGLVLASVVAMASKYLLAIHRRHIFNPVAIGVVASALLLDQPATWWVGGNLELLPFVLIGGMLVVRKVQRFDMLGAYIAADFIATLVTTSPDHMHQALTEALMSSPMLFAGFAMLTEPLTAPHALRPRIAFGVIVGVLSSPNIHFGAFYLTPEMAFLVGNLFAFATNPQGRFKLTLLRIERIAEGCYDFVFQSDRQLAHQPGQYLDWTLDVPTPDDRGNRRPFTIASAPAEAEVRLGAKFYDRPSAFKKTLGVMRPGDTIYASHVAGEFTLPANHQEKLAFIAGGIGVTPFRSMVQHMLDNHDRRSVVLLYGTQTVDEVAYSDVFERAVDELGLRAIYAIAEGSVEAANVYRGMIDEVLIRREIPDYQDRIFYISGPRAMVVTFQRLLRRLGVARRRIKVDYFPGFA